MCSLNVNLSNIFISNLNTCLTLRKKGKRLWRSIQKTIVRYKTRSFFGNISLILLYITTIKVFEACFASSFYYSR